MERRDNYRIQVQQAKQRFLTYDQQEMIRRCALRADDAYLYPVMLGRQYRVCRKTGDVERLLQGVWVDGNAFNEVMTLFDWLCDSRADRYITGRWKNMTDFGLQFHQNLMETGPNPTAVLFERNHRALRSACIALGGQPLPQGDVSYSIELFDGLTVAVQLWLGDEEFPPRLRYLWDANADRYIRYETMYYAVGLLQSRLREHMEL